MLPCIRVFALCSQLRDISNDDLNEPLSRSNRVASVNLFRITLICVLNLTRRTWMSRDDLSGVKLWHESKDIRRTGAKKLADWLVACRHDRETATDTDRISLT